MSSTKSCSSPALRAALAPRIAGELGAAGAKVMLGARRTDRLEALADEIRATGGEAHDPPP